MGRIEIRHKLKPFSTLAGIEVPFPQVERVFQIYPTKVLIEKNEKVELELDWKFESRVTQITTFFDLVHQRIEVQLKLESGVVHYDLLLNDKGLCVCLKRNTTKSASLKVGNKPFKKIKPSSVEHLLPTKHVALDSLEVLSFGSHKKQELEPLLRREDPKEILPLLFALGQMCPASDTKSIGHLKRVKDAKVALKKNQHDQVLSIIKPLFASAFSGLFVPHLDDVFYWEGGQAVDKGLSPFSLLKALYELIRSFIIESKNGSVSVLAHLPPELFCGRAISFHVHGCIVDIEWTKKALRRMRIQAKENTSFCLNFQKSIQKCRLKVNNRSATFKSGEIITLEKSKTYYFDRFEK